jgi:hypothetical protein
VESGKKDEGEEGFNAARRCTSSSSSDCLYPGSTGGAVSKSKERGGELGCMAGREEVRRGWPWEVSGCYAVSMVDGRGQCEVGVFKVGERGKAAWGGEFTELHVEESQWKHLMVSLSYAERE